MSDSQTPYSRYVSRVSDRKKRKLSVDETSKQKWARVEPFDIDLFAPIESQMICSQSSKNECGDLFSAPLPHVKWVNTPPPIKKSNKKTSVTKSEKKSKKNIGSSNSFKKRKSWNVPPVPNMDRTIEEAQQEWYKLMGPEKSSNDVSALSNGSLNISGVQPLNESSPNLNSSENEKKSSEVLKGK